MKEYVNKELVLERRNQEDEASLFGKTTDTRGLDNPAFPEESSSTSGSESDTLVLDGRKVPRSPEVETDFSTLLKRSYVSLPAPEPTVDSARNWVPMDNCMVPEASGRSYDFRDRRVSSGRCNCRVRTPCRVACLAFLLLTILAAIVCLVLLQVIYDYGLVGRILGKHRRSHSDNLLEDSTEDFVMDATESYVKFETLPWDVLNVEDDPETNSTNLAYNSTTQETYRPDDVTTYPIPNSNETGPTEAPSSLLSFEERLSKARPEELEELLDLDNATETSLTMADLEEMVQRQRIEKLEDPERLQRENPEDRPLANQTPMKRNHPNITVGVQILKEFLKSLRLDQESRQTL